MTIDNITDVENFLSDFFQKKKIWGIRFANERMKNIDALAALEITALERERIIDNIKPTDYSEGPVKDKMSIESDMWIFGKIVKKQEVYIKITIGNISKPVICISFHPSEKPMVYPFKSE